MDPGTSLSSSSSSSIEIPPQWPPQVVELYEPVLELGRGGFASVVLARSKKDPKQLHAIKVVGSKMPTRQESE